MDVTTTLVLLTSGAALIGSAVSLVLVYVSRPSALRRETDLLHDAVDAFERNELKRDADAVKMLQGVEGIHQAVIDDLARVEKKRRAAQGAATAAERLSGNEKGDGAAIDWTDRAQVEAYAARIDSGD